MGKEIRRLDRQIPESEAKEILYREEFGFLATVSSDGQPYGIPISYCYLDNIIYFHSAVVGHKLENICSNNNVSFCVVGKREVLPAEFSTKYESVIAFGKAYEITGEEKKKVLLEFVKKYSPEHINKGIKYIDNSEARTRVFKIVVDYITGKSKK